MPSWKRRTRRSTSKRVDLSTAITNLTTQIDETKRKLAASEGEKGFLEKELKRLMAEKAELERQFNDLTVLRAQVVQVEGGAFGCPPAGLDSPGLLRQHRRKGAQKLMQGSAASQAKPPKPTYDLNVEVSADGSVKVIPPLTNRPAGDQSAGQMTEAGLLIDSQGRILRDLRVSLTDRCNFRCLYCLPETEAAQNFYRGHWAHLPNPAPIVQQWVPQNPPPDLRGNRTRRPRSPSAWASKRSG